MGLRYVIALTCLLGASGLQLEEKHGLRKSSIAADLSALERFASAHAIDEDLSKITEDTGASEDPNLLANVTAIAEKQSQAPVAAHGIFIPHGKNVPQVPGQKYMIATTYMECQLCKRLIHHGEIWGYNFPLSSHHIVAEFQQMADAMTKVLHSCPEFMNKWCYQDLGGSQKLRGPCPDHLVCHYCLGLNPLMCV